ncbi:hypothetical protein [Streptomyces paludis]|uniref:Uncharacterized protein n=1 Tax=Streptomyces paludis TaxID=2282738 RepID=A0A345HSZ1_9ACTN|nr:hypothetical protein [Streptomyces paludis]AXG79815.1 hypothetical protein DVK44_21585 [Streptomyces paludis]
MEKQLGTVADPPDVIAYAIEAICRAGRLGRADLEQVLAAIDRVLSGRMDSYESAQVAGMRMALRARPDFGFEMYFYGLTYFGAAGVEMFKGLVQQLDTFEPQLVELIGDGRFDRD